MTYAIYEDNMERLNKKLATIKKKCEKNNILFTYKEVGEEFRDFRIGGTIENPVYETRRFVLVETFGVAKINNWKFVGTVDHLEAGNIIRKADNDLEIPEKYYTSESYCEHCNTKRRRGSTCLIFNEETGEWKQVGKTCLCEFTNGLDAEAVAAYMSAFDALIKGEAPYDTNVREWRWYNLKEALRYVVATYNHFGFVSVSSEEPGNRSTASRSSDYFLVGTGRSIYMTQKQIERIQNEMDSVNFNIKAPGIEETCEDIIQWIRNEPESNNYFHNLKVIFTDEYFRTKDWNIFASVISAYKKHVDYEAYKKAQEELHKNEAVSNYVGEPGDRVEVNPSSIELITSRESEYGVSYLFKFKDANDNIFCWWSSSWGGNLIDKVEKDGTPTIKGTVKKHSEYKGVKQTELTRCRVTFI